MWWNICGSSGNKVWSEEIRDKVCVKNRNIAEKRMSPSQIKKAQRLARNWKPKK
jgi:hypothetical protein